MNEQDIKDQEKLNRAELARQVLENPVYKDAFMMVRATYIDKMAKVDPKDIDELQTITRGLQNLDRIERVISRTMEAGRVVAEKRRSLFRLNQI